MCLRKKDTSTILHNMQINGVHIKESNTFYSLFYSLQRSQQERARHQHWKDTSLTFNELCHTCWQCRFVCKASATYCGFIHGSLRVGLLKRYSYSSAVTLVAFALSYLTIKRPHTFIILIFWRSKISICGFNNQLHLHLSNFAWNAAQTTSWSGLSDQIEMRLESVSEDIYTWGAGLFHLNRIRSHFLSRVDT